ncbi:AAA family ATPase [Caulobacter sp. CCUG 60055]|uniref:IS21-like element helper ATPase IstB n=1 Tax=Caulobacter sp. CCUG 60055 TaxID=2100090 RepID=UPI001FA7BCF9|nr:IS21-like element helper ATPase IstB [Caulobacter sp. CCUG 60055]MCI3181596.1 AAA family ATPase [Caulobacter sp. CCUG 60055]
MNTNHIIDKLRDLGLHGMISAIEHHAESPAFSELPFSDRFMHVLQAEAAWRDDRRHKRILRAARLKIPAAAEDIDYRPGRNLDRSQIAELLTCAWILKGENLILTGATGTGKTHMACAFGGQAARHGMTARYVRTNQLLEDMALAHQDGSIGKVRAALSRFDLLILDDFGLAPMTELGKQDLLDIIDARVKTASTLLAGQLPFKEWHSYIDNPMVADAILDRMINTSHRVQLSGESMRKLKAGPTS